MVVVKDLILIGLLLLHFKQQIFFLQKAEAQLAYELQAAKIQQRIRQEEIQIQVKILPFSATNNNFS